MSVPKALGIQTSTPTILRSGKKKIVRYDVEPPWNYPTSLVPNPKASS